MIKINVIFIILLMGLADCSGGRFLTKQDYLVPTEYLREGNVSFALHTYPTSEKKTFITLMEKTYLNLLAGKPEIDELGAYAKKIDNRVRFKITREMKSVFYLETPEGYYASEHEVILMHLFLSWGFSLRGDFDKAYVEAKICANLLSNSWSEEGRFDDPFLRILLAGIWAKCGYWEDAQVDFRKAAELDPSLTWAGILGNLDKPPSQLVLLLGGIGPDTVWDPELKRNLIRGFRNVSFKSRGLRSPLAVSYGPFPGSPMFLTPDSAAWYNRHLRRDNEIQDIIRDSYYGRKLAQNTLRVSAWTVGGVLAGTAVAAGGIAAGGAIMYLGLAMDSIDIASLGLVPIIGGTVWGVDIAKSAYYRGIEDSEKDLDISEIYRYVRFLPEYAWVSWTSRNFTDPPAVYSRNNEVLKFQEPPQKESGGIAVHIGYYPDSGISSVLAGARKSPQEDPDTDPYALMSLIKAIKAGNTYEAVMLINHGADVNVSNPGGETALLMAVENNNIALAKLLIGHGAIAGTANRQGKTPLHLAAKWNRIEMMEFLLQHGAGVDAPDNESLTPLSLAVMFERQEAVELLIRKGASLRVQDKHGWTLLHDAVRSKNEKLMEYLLKSGVNINARIVKSFNNYPAGSTPLTIAKIDGNAGIAAILQRYGAIE